MQNAQRPIVDLLARMRMATPQLLQQWFGKSANQIKNEIRALRGEWLESHPFFGGQVYYRLTESACRRLNVSRRLAGPLGPQALRRDYGVLHFAAHTSPPRKLLTREDWAEFATGEPPHSHLYLDTDADQLRIGLIFVDGRSDVAALLRKPSGFMRRRSGHPSLRRLIDNDEFLFAFVTESEGKAESIDQACRRAKFPHAIRLHVCSDLAFL